MSKTKVNSRKVILVRAYLVFGLLAVFAIAIFVTAVKLQLGTDDKFREEMSAKNTRIKEIEALRGNIYADDGSLLATSVPKYDVVFDLRADGLTSAVFIAKIDSFSMMMSRMFPERSTSDWKEHFIKHREKRTRYLKIGKDLGFEQVKAIRTWPIARLGKFKGGIWYEEKGKRMYFMGELAKRTIGYIKDKTAVGLEGAFDTLLRGKNGTQMQQRMSGQTWRPIQVGNNRLAVNGKDIVTTLDVRIQDIAQYALQKGLEAESADHGCVIVMETNTGAIKAMANLKRGEDGQYYEAQNYAVSEFTEPGSTFKLVSAIALLEDGKISTKDTIDNSWGKWSWYDLDLEDAVKPKKRFYTLGECLQYSSNVGTSKFVMQHYKKDPEKFTQHAMDLGLHIKPKFDIPSSNGPSIATPEKAGWSGTSLPSLSIGYSSQISPLQTLMLYNTVATKGKLMQPYMVKEIRHEGQTLSKIEPIVLKEQAISAKTAATLTEMLTQVIDNGTAIGIKTENYKIAGKTGTAWLSQGKAGYNQENNRQFQASFAGFFPANNPQYTIVVVVNNPKGARYSGSQIAAPIFKNISDRIYSTHIKVQPALQTASLPQVPGILKGDLNKTKWVLNEIGISSQLLLDSSKNNKNADPVLTGKYIEATKEAHSVKLKPVTVNNNTIPDLRGMGLRDALKILSDMGLKASYSGYGRITDQAPAPNAKRAASNEVVLILKPY
jgi:cell division protein FtsI (penicillin-binding protein 3)